MWGALMGVLDDALQVVGATHFCRDPFVSLGSGDKGKGKSSSSRGGGGDGDQPTQAQEMNQTAGAQKLKLASPFVSDHIALFRAVDQSKRGTDQYWLKGNGLQPRTVSQMADAAQRLRADLPEQGILHFVHQSRRSYFYRYYGVLRGGEYTYWKGSCRLCSPDWWVV